MILVGLAVSVGGFALFVATDILVRIASDSLGVLGGPGLVIAASGLFGPVLWLWRRREVMLTGTVVLRSVLLATAASCAYAAIALVPLAEAYALFLLAPLTVGVASRLALGERSLGPVAALLGFVGAILALRPGFTELRVGHLFAVGMMVFFSASMLVQARSVMRGGPQPKDLDYVTGVLLAKLPIGIVLIVISGATIAPQHLTLAAPAAVMFLLGQVALVLSYRMLPASLAAPSMLMQLPFGAVAGAVVFGEMPDGLQIAGCAVILAAAALQWTNALARPARARP
ncbi:MAG: DMT family transporter [Azospirillaceae bacterium]